MRALRFGSYSIDATLAGTPSLSRRKSMTRYFCLWPPPRWREVIRPYELRPPVFGLCSVSDFSGRSRVTSAKSETVWNRRPGLVGLRLRIGMRLAPEDLDAVALGERDDRPLLAGALTPPARAPVALALPATVEGVHVLDLDVEDLLDGLADLHLVRVVRDDERVDVLVVGGVGLLRHDRSDHDVARITVLHPAAASPASLAAAGETSVAGPRSARRVIAASRVARENTSQSFTSTS